MYITILSIKIIVYKKNLSERKEINQMNKIILNSYSWTPQPNKYTFNTFLTIFLFLSYLYLSSLFFSQESTNIVIFIYFFSIILFLILGDHKIFFYSNLSTFKKKLGGGDYGPCRSTFSLIFDR